MEPELSCSRQEEFNQQHICQDALSQSVNTLHGIGRQTANHLQKLRIFQIQDLLFHLPLRYLDRTRIYPIATLSPGISALVRGQIEVTDVVMRGRRSLVCKISDGTGILMLRFFHFSAKQHNQLQAGTLISCFGEVRNSFAGLEIVHPEYKILNDLSDCATESNLTPVYPLTDGVRQTTLRKAIKQALTLCTNNKLLITDWIPKSVLNSMDLPSLTQSIQTLHEPDESISIEQLETAQLPALKRLAFEEFLAHHLSRLQCKIISKSWQAPKFISQQEINLAFFDTLPFQLTTAQHRVIKEIITDCSSHSPMLRLIQGDVGSGKTVVAAFAALLAINSGYQVAVMAPTELLAEQHLQSFTAWFLSFNIPVLLLTGQTKGKRRKAVLESIADESACIVIGTHALFQDAVQFSRLGLIIIDEQHRFGVNQRLALRDKGSESGKRPHQLVMTATPIPRTLAMLNYADLDISVIDELPPGRKEIITSAISAQRRDEVIDKITGWVNQGRQAYWVCTLIEESEVLQNQAAEKTLEKLELALPNVRIALVHGRMKSAEKEKQMLAFKQHKIDLLVATTVIEVGVDIANAGLMIIENPERLGLSQLHQLRGRVGRGTETSYCLLMYQAPLSETAHQRLGILRETTDGFVIAEKDLQLRGPGEMLGTRQTGQIQFKIADIGRDTELLGQVNQTAALMLEQCPEAIQPLIDRWLGDTTHYAEV